MDDLRNKALADANTYNAKSMDNAYFDMMTRTKQVVDAMPLFTQAVADRIAERQNELARKAILESVISKFTGAEYDGADLTVTDKIKLCKTLKKDGYYTKVYHCKPYLLNPNYTNLTS